MPDLTALVDHWGYLAIFLVVTLGNVGLPVPEETILALAGYLVWAGHLRLPLVLVVGVISAVAGDNLGYWLGRRFGRSLLERHGSRILVTPDRLATMQRFVATHGPPGIVVARFLPGLRFMAGPVAGAIGLPFPAFLAANLLGAAAYVPIVVGLGYAVGYGFGAYLESARHVLGEVEHVVLLAALAGTVAVWGWRALARHDRP